MNCRQRDGDDSADDLTNDGTDNDLKDGPNGSVSVRRRCRLRGPERHDSRQHQASENDIVFPVTHGDRAGFKAYTNDVYLLPKELVE